VQGKPGLFFAVIVFLSFGLFMGCRSGPSYQASGDAAYRAIERDADRNSADLAATGAAIAAGAGAMEERAGRVAGGLSDVEGMIRASSLGEAEKGALLRHVAAAQAEGGALAAQAAGVKADAGLLASQLEQQREIAAALSAEHDRREAEAAALGEELADTREKLAKAAGRRDLYLVILIALGLAAAGYAVFRVLRLLRVIPV
jgi:hypothetical protein